MTMLREYYKWLIGLSDEELASVFEIRERIKTQERREHFIPGKTRIQYAGDYTDGKEQREMLNAIMQGRLALGKKGAEFEEKLGQKLGIPKVWLTNSGSSANLLAINALRSAELKDEKGHLKAGDGMISTALNFPTTINPIIQSGMIPVLVDSELGSYTINLEQMKEMIENAKNNVKAIMIPHLFGSANNMDEIMKIAGKHGLYVVEDCCDAFGPTWNNKLVGTYGDMSTFSFYPAHHITIGEGGAVGINNNNFSKPVRSLREWGRACWCGSDSSPNGACGKRFSWQLGELPYGYDHKFTYTNIGFNLKPTEICAAMGIPQLEKMEFILKRREENFSKLYNTFKNYDAFILPKPLEKANNRGWFFFPITVKPDAKFKTDDMIKFLDTSRNIETRRLFTGNITRHPAYCNAKYLHSVYNTRIITAEKLDNADYILQNSFIIGTSQVITNEKMNYVCESIEEYMKTI